MGGISKDKTKRREMEIEDIRDFFPGFVDKNKRIKHLSS